MKHEKQKHLKHSRGFVIMNQQRKEKNMKKFSTVAATLQVAFLFTVFLTTSQASVPKEQAFSDDKVLNSVVRILAGADKDGKKGSFVGTGSIIGKGMVNGNYMLCLLTADHVLADDYGDLQEGLAFAFGNANPPGNGDGTLLDKKLIFRWGPDRRKPWDLAVVGAKVSKEDYEKALVRELAVEGNEKAEFTLVGFGITGEKYIGDPRGAYDMVDKTSGIQRWMNNKRISITADFTPNYKYNRIKYVFNNMEWQLNPKEDVPKGVQKGDWVEGEGYSGRGDSGAPYFSTGRDAAGKPFTDRIIGIHAWGQELQGLIFWGATAGGVSFRDIEVKWIQEKCAAIVPEPTTALLFSFLVAGYLLRRAKKTN